MTAQTAPAQAGVTTGYPARPGPSREARQPGLSNRMARYGIWFAVGVRCLGDRRLQASVITGVIGVYAAFNVVKNNQARPMRRVVRWYNVKGEVHEMEVLHRARRAAKPGTR